MGVTLSHDSITLWRMALGLDTDQAFLLSQMIDVTGGGQGIKRTASVDSPQEVKRARHGSTGAAGVTGAAAARSEGKPIDKQYCDAVVNFLLRIACQVIGFPTPGGHSTSMRGSALSLHLKKEKK